MATTPDNALTTTPAPDGRGPAPLWVWLLVLLLVALAIYAGYTAVANYQLYYDTDTARQALARDKDRLEANVADLQQQVEGATKARTEAENALKQSRADTQTAADQVSELQDQLAQANDKIVRLEGSKAAADAKARQAMDAKAALEQEVESLKSKLNEIQSKLDSALSDLSNAQEQSKAGDAPAAP